MRALSMGELRHAMVGTAAVAIVVAAAIPGTLVNLAASGKDGSNGALRQSVRLGHPSGTRVGAEVVLRAKGECKVTQALMSRTARILMERLVR